MNDIKNTKQDDNDIKLTQKQVNDVSEIARTLNLIYKKGYSSTGKMMLMFFLRGIAYGFGAFLGGTIIVSLALAILNLFGIKLNWDHRDLGCSFLRYTFNLC